MKYECKQNDCLIEISEDKSELLISINGDTQKLVIGLKDLNQALSLFNVSETAEDCLKQIADPINHLRKQAEKEDCVLDGMMAVKITEDHNYLKQLAIDWLRTNSR